MSLKTENSEIFINFNQSKAYCCFGTPIGFYIYSLNPLRKVLSRKIEGGISIIKMLYESNIVLFVGRTNKGSYPNNKLIIWDDSRKSVLGEIQYNNKIENLHVTKKFIIVLVDSKIFIYNFETLFLVKSFDYKNDLKLIEIAENNNYLVYPSEKQGVVCITKFESDFLKEIKAHENSISQIHVSSNGNYLVTASVNGTVIRIFDIKSGNKINEFRRGTDPTTIVNLELNHDNSILLVSSIKGTIHLFNTGIKEMKNLENSSFENYGMSYVKWTGLMPQYFHDQWSFSRFNLPDIISYSVFEPSKPIIYSFGNDGQFYELNYENPNDPKIEKTIKYISDENDPFSERTSTIK